MTRGDAIGRAPHQRRAGSRACTAARPLTHARDAERPGASRRPPPQTPARHSLPQAFIVAGGASLVLGATWFTPWWNPGGADRCRATGLASRVDRSPRRRRGSPRPTPGRRLVLALRTRVSRSAHRRAGGRVGRHSRRRAARVVHRLDSLRTASHRLRRLLVGTPIHDLAVATQKLDRGGLTRCGLG